MTAALGNLLEGANASAGIPDRKGGAQAANAVPKNETLPRSGGVMMCGLRILLALLLVAAVAAAATSVRASDADDADSAFRSGLSAFNAGRYALALAEWRPLAAAGDAKAQESLGFMYYSGRGVPRDSRKAASFFYRAANQGEPTAQLFLAIMHFRADGVAQSTPLAMMWSELAMSGGLSEAYELNDTIMQSMSEAERAEGRRLVVRWRELFAAAKRKSD